MCTCSSSSSSHEQEYMCTCSNQSSPTISPASTPSPPKLKRQSTKLKLPHQKSKIPRKTGKPLVDKLPSCIPVRCTSTPLPTSENPIITISSSSEISDTVHSSEFLTNSPPSSKDGSLYLPPEQFPDSPKIGNNAQKDLDEMDTSLDNFDLGEVMTRTSTRPNFFLY